MVVIDVENPALAEPIAAMVDMVVAAGGTVASELTIVERGGSMSLHRPFDATQAACLAAVPAAVLVPAGELDWADRDDSIALASEPAGLTPERRRMLDLLLAIYNATGKLDWLADCFNVVAQRDPSMLAAVRRVKPSAIPSEGPLAERFLGTRVIYLGQEAGDLAGAPLLMPIFDFLNHHPSGGSYLLDNDLLVVPERHAAGTSECFADYAAKRDVFDLLVWCHYVDHETCYAATTAGQWDLPELGRLRIESRFAVSNHMAHPPIVTFEEDGVVLSHLVFDRGNPRPTLQLLEMALLALARRRGVPDSRASKAMADLPAALLDTNLEALAALRADLDARTDRLPLTDMLRRAADIHEANLVAALSPARSPAHGLRSVSEINASISASS